MKDLITVLLIAVTATFARAQGDLRKQLEEAVAEAAALQATTDNLVKRKSDFADKINNIIEQACSSPEAHTRWMKDSELGGELPSTVIMVRKTLEAIDRNCSGVDKQTRAQLEAEALAIDDFAVLWTSREKLSKHTAELAVSPQ